MWATVVHDIPYAARAFTVAIVYAHRATSAKQQVEYS